MKKLISRITIFAFLTITTMACSSSEDAPATNVTPVTSGTFTWRENDPSSTTIQTAATSSFSTQFKTLTAKNVSGTTIFEINLTSTTIGTYNFGSGTGNVFAFTITNPSFEATSGNFKITANGNGKLSGTFEAFRSGTGITRLYGVVTDITVNP